MPSLRIESLSYEQYSYIASQILRIGTINKMKFRQYVLSFRNDFIGVQRYLSSEDSSVYIKFCYEQGWFIRRMDWTEYCEALNGFTVEICGEIGDKLKSSVAWKREGF